MRIVKKDLMITQKNEASYQLYLRQRWMFFFERWIPLTYQEGENSEEIIYEFKSFDEATEFINLITE